MTNNKRKKSNQLFASLIGNVDEEVGRQLSLFKALTCEYQLFSCEQGFSTNT